MGQNGNEASKPSNRRWVTTGRATVKSGFPWCLALLLGLWGCGEREPVVAEFGPYRITLAEFRLAYLNVIKQPNTFDSPELREQFLDELIRRRLLAEEARRLGLDRDERIRLRVEAYRNKCLREAHYNSVIRPRVRVNERQLREVFRFLREKRRLKHLFAETRSGADSLYHLLQQGVPFDTLARHVFRDSLLAHSGGDLGWVTWDQLDYDVAMTAFRLPLNTFSKPVKSQYGYHILMVTGYETTPIITETDYQQRRDKVRYLLEFKIGDKLAAEYIEKLMAGRRIQVNPGLLKFVGDQLAATIHRKPTPLEELMGKGLKESEIGQLELSLWDVRNQTLATLDGEPITVGQFISALAYVPRDAILRGYKTALDFVLRDFAITRDAIRMGLDRSVEVRRKVRLYEDYLLKVKMTRKLVRELKVSDSEVRHFYQAHREDLYRNLPFDSVKSVVRKRVLQEKRLKLLPEHAALLTRGMTVRKYPEVIHRFYQRVYRKEGVATD